MMAFRIIESALRTKNCKRMIWLHLTQHGIDNPNAQIVLIDCDKYSSKGSFYATSFWFPLEMVDEHDGYPEPKNEFSHKLIIERAPLG